MIYDLDFLKFIQDAVESTPWAPGSPPSVQEVSSRDFALQLMRQRMTTSTADLSAMIAKANGPISLKQVMLSIGRTLRHLLIVGG
jgi:hypothetical protein